MKIAVAFLALVALAYSAPQPRSLFHEHFNDFVELITLEVFDELQQLIQQYLEFEEFQAGLNYISSPNFKSLVYEMEDIPEFKAVVEFLETHDIDILFFIQTINDAVDRIPKRSSRQQASGRDISAFIRDTVSVFPKDKLIALYDQKIEENEEFRLAMENFFSDEWDQIYGALWQSQVFLQEVQELYDNGIDVEVLLTELRAIMGIYD